MSYVDNCNITSDHCQHADTNRKALPKKRASNRTHGDLANSLIEIAVEQINSTKSTEFALRELASKLGASHAAAYRHFKNKHSLVEAIALRGFQKMSLIVQNKLESSKTPLSSLGEAYIDFAVTHPGYFRVMFGTNFSRTENLELKKASQQSFEALTQMFNVRQHSGPEKAIFAWVVVHGLSMLLIDGQIDLAIEALGLKKKSLQKKILALTTKALL